MKPSGCVSRFSSRSTNFSLFQVNWNISSIFVLICCFCNIWCSLRINCRLAAKTLHEQFNVTEEVTAIFRLKSSKRWGFILLSLSDGFDFVYFWAADVLDVSDTVRHRGGEGTTKTSMCKHAHTHAHTNDHRLYSFKFQLIYCLNKSTPRTK